MRRALAILGSCSLTAVVLLAATDGPDPRVFRDDSGRLVVARLPSLPTDAEVRRHLDSGLTTSLVLQGGPQGAPRRGAARIDVRFELWDEVYLATVIDGEGRVERTRQESAAALAAWLSEVEIVLTPRQADGAGSAGQARVSLAVVPFSQAELQDTQRWLAESIGRGRAGGGAADAGAVGVLIATSMQRRAVRTLTWVLPIERRAGP